ncbi:thioredoxin [Cohnella luojiensis]|uniref:Thioredoxin n=1 Tax=Cohnella luojiensis TaxID=652876 RepID=A0A4Y8LTD8_9BACL|nr:thioredoxin [Cohnella luojiensis]TFE24834.1 thioredoxin [Cohnella luojiensis]
MLAVNDTTFRNSVKQQGVTLVDFGAPWCPPCKVLKPILDELGEEYGENLSVLEVNCDESPAVATEYGIMSMPTVLVFHNGEPVEKLVGLRPKAAYESLLSKYV